MEIENQVGIPEPIQTQVQPQLTPDPIATKKTTTPYLIGALVLLVMVATGAYYLGTQNSEKISQVKNTAIQPTTQPIGESPSISPQIIDRTKDWVSHEVSTLGLALRLPAYLTQMEDPGGGEVVAEYGKQFCLQYMKSDIVSYLVKRVWAGGGACSPTYFGLGTTSTDYEAGRMGGFGDLQGYVIENGRFFAKMPMGEKQEISSELAREVVNSNGVKILQVFGKNHAPSAPDLPAWPVAGTPGDGRIGALINLENNASYEGVAVEMKLDEKLDEDLFEEILSTFQFMN